MRLKHLPVSLAGLALLGFAGCRTTRVVGYPAEYVATRGPSHVWVTEANNNTVELWNPTVHGDTLAGFDRGSFDEIPLDSIKLMKASEVNAGRTALLAGGTAIGAAAIVATLMGSGNGSTCITPGTDFVTPCQDPNNPNTQTTH
ncbi:MAG TPA: hypothetical protein VLT79_06235 [Gemmatimonadales bacterium]|nr:hypothetical protein [Gemmatimonadales bacterium]